MEAAFKRAEENSKHWVKWIYPKSKKEKCIMGKFQELTGKEVICRSASGIEYLAVVTDIPINPEHKNTCFFPTVSLEFLNQNGKFMRKERVLPREASFSIIELPPPQGWRLSNKRKKTTL
jgi:hypothetical protein